MCVWVCVCVFVRGLVCAWVCVRDRGDGEGDDKDQVEERHVTGVCVGVCVCVGAVACTHLTVRAKGRV